MLQVIYISTAVGPCDTDAILAASRRNNARDGVTGLLYSDGCRFMQALEGPAAAVEATFERIRCDPRHRAVVRLSRREVAEREFGEWHMAERAPGEEGAAFAGRVTTLVAATDANVRATFDGFARWRNTA